MRQTVHETGVTSLSLTLTVETTPSDGLSGQRIEAIKAALRELGLPDNIAVE